jgi:asparagine synthase (glutamine-hydrolysing)
VCGIAGFAGAGTREDLLAMTRAVAHRGPDGEGFFEDARRRVFLGHRRLAILDIPGGAQPLWNEDGTVCVIFNGEIYNHADLRRDLQGLGHVFHSHHADTEVLVHGYEQWGEDLPARLNGMFAFAVYDTRSPHLFLARDRFGEKPLYYLHRPGLFAFASELHALRQHSQCATPISPLAVQKYFAHGFIPAPHALYRDCRKLAGGSSLRLDARDGTVKLNTYYRFQLAADRSLDQRPEADLAAELRHLLRQATRRRLMSDVPLGLFLSGGIDSGAVLACAARESPEPVQTFTVGFTEPSFDESPFAQALADRIGTHHHCEVLDLDLARELLPAVLGHLDEPQADPSILPTSLLSGFTRKHVKVALSGDGGDELFAGYDPFRALGLASIYHALVPGPAHRGLRALVERLPVSPRNMSLEFALKRTLLGLTHAKPLWNPVWLGPLAPEAWSEVFDEPFAPEEIYSEVLDRWRRDETLSLLDRTLEFYTQFYLPENILAKVDRAAMMHSLEARAVFLDVDLVDFCRRLPARWKYRHGHGKYLLRKALAPLLPASVLARRKKGFGIPIARWLGHLPPAFDRVIAAGLMKPEAVRERWEAHRAGRADHRLFLWAVLVLEAHLSAARPPAHR